MHRKHRPSVVPHKSTKNSNQTKILAGKGKQDPHASREGKEKKRNRQIVRKVREHAWDSSSRSHARRRKMGNVGNASMLHRPSKAPHRYIVCSSRQVAYLSKW
eukprot:scaffold544_cov320-Pavlova_lutheri.AAC.5